ncbi:MAG: hypothetical protein KAT79_01100 [candidate division Zixibacteria bacterium]|nr:hypothetical protein [candidate division Zixibacteria bacterium]
MRRLTLIILALLSVGGVSAVDLSTIVLNSTEDLETALQLGEIDSVQFLTLKELLLHGLDSTNLHLFDQVPNLSFVAGTAPDRSGLLKGEQTAPFFVSKPAVLRMSGRFTSKFDVELEPQGRSRYQSSLQLEINKCLEISLKVRREYSGVERIIARHLRYTRPDGRVREIRVGSFSNRFGLGTVFGYRGKLLDFAEEIGSESVLYPDNGGYNGVYGRFQTGSFNSQVLASLVRDDNHSLRSFGAMLSRQSGRTSVGLIVGQNQLENRETDVAISRSLCGVYFDGDYTNGKTAMELSLQSGEGVAAIAAVCEGLHLIGSSDIRYSAWWYDQALVDLTSGSKAINLRRQNEIDEVDFSYSDKRSGQLGGMLKTSIPLIENVRMFNAGLIGFRSSDTSMIQFLTGIERKTGKAWSFRIDYLNQTRRHTSSVVGGREINQRTRLETRFASGKISMRSYIAHSTKTGARDYLAVFAGCRYRTDKMGTLQIWSNLTRIDPTTMVTGYWYWYLRYGHELIDGVELGVKISNRYDRQKTEANYGTVSLELSGVL